jgi:D-glycero-D-manno-heptose 1,7-bisphosphate phosphatase
MPTVRNVSAPHGRRAIRWVFLDRDGTLNVKPPDGEYVGRPEELRLLPGVAEAVRTLNRAGVWTGVVTNQRGIALGRMSIEDLDAVHERLVHLLQERGAFVDAIYACPHGLDACDCRKPRPGLLLQAQREYPALDFADAAIVGDSPSDVQAGRRLGLRTVLISGSEGDEHAVESADHRVSDLIQAASVLLPEPQAGATPNPPSDS